MSRALNFARQRLPCKRRGNLIINGDIADSRAVGGPDRSTHYRLSVKNYRAGGYKTIHPAEESEAMTGLYRRQNADVFSCWVATQIEEKYRKNTKI